MNKDCKIVQELLPNYIEKLSSEEVNNYIEEHLKSCDECKNILDNMQNHITTNLKTDDKEVDFLKKIRKKIQLLIITIILILVFILVFIWGSYVRKFMILSTITDNISNIKNTENYYAKAITIQDHDSLHIIESYVTQKQILTNMKILSDKEIKSSSFYKNNNENGYRFIYHNDKVIQDYKDDSGFIKVGLSNYSDMFTDLNFFDRLLFTKKLKNISTSYCRGYLCYFLDFFDGLQLWIDKDTGLTIRAINSAKSQNPDIQEYEYNFEPFDSIELPNPTGYTIFSIT